MRGFDKNKTSYFSGQKFCPWPFYFWVFVKKTCEKVAIWPKKVAICPLLKIKVASKNYEIS